MVHLLFLVHIKTDSMSERLKVAITIGDFNGIGLEVCLKALSNPVLRKKIVPILYGSPKVVSYHKNILKGC